VGRVTTGVDCSRQFPISGLKWFFALNLDRLDYALGPAPLISGRPRPVDLTCFGRNLAPAFLTGVVPGRGWFYNECHCSLFSVLIGAVRSGCFDFEFLKGMGTFQ
jgi:hypothetical protein